MPVSSHDLFLMGKNEESLSRFKEEFDQLRNSLNEHGDPEVEKVHKCNRDFSCKCVLQCQLLINIADKLELEMGHILNSFFFKPEVFLPYESFLYWIQYEIYRERYEKAENLIREYVSNSTQLMDRERQKPLTNQLQRFASASIAFKSVSSQIILYESQFYELMEILLFHCVFISRGYDQARQILRDTPMSKRTKLFFVKRLILFTRAFEPEHSGSSRIDEQDLREELEDKLSEVEEEQQQGNEQEGQQVVLARGGVFQRVKKQIMMFAVKFKWNLVFLGVVLLVVAMRKTAGFNSVYEKLKQMSILKWLGRVFFGLKM